MKTLIETKTGKAVNAGDVIMVEGSAHILTDFDVPGLVGRGILTFACAETPSTKKVDIQPTSEVDKTDIPAVDVDNSTDDYRRKGFIPIFDPKHLVLKKTLFDWGIKMGLKTEDEVLQYAALLKAATPVGFLGVILREFADRFNVYDTYQSQEWAFDCANNRIVKVNPQAMLYPENVVMFNDYKILQECLTACQELVDEICPNGEQED